MSQDNFTADEVCDQGDGFLEMPISSGAIFSNEVFLQTPAPSQALSSETPSQMPGNLNVSLEITFFFFFFFFALCNRLIWKPEIRPVRYYSWETHWHPWDHFAIWSMRSKLLASDISESERRFITQDTMCTISSGNARPCNFISLGQCVSVASRCCDGQPGNGRQRRTRISSDEAAGCNTQSKSKLSRDEILFTILGYSYSLRYVRE